MDCAHLELNTPWQSSHVGTGLYNSSALFWFQAAAASHDVQYI